MKVVTARTIAADIRDGRRSAPQMVEEALATIARIDPQVQAFEFVDPAIVRAQVRPNGVLAGVTVAVKDVIATRDMPTGHANARHAGTWTGTDAACIDTLRSAGAVILGKTVTTEFAATGRGGRTRNPHDLARSPGGSSSGSAAAVAAGMAMLAVGSQTGGSMIRPASFTGIWGWKPTWGTISNEGVKAFSVSCDTVGFYARAADDLALLAEVFDLDPAPRPATLHGLRIGLCRTPAWPRVEPPMRAAFDRAAAILRHAGAGVECLTLPPAFGGLHDAQIRIMLREGRTAFLNEYRAAPDLHPEFRAMVENAQHLTPDQMRADYALADRCRAALDDVLSDFDAIIAPSACGEAPKGLGWTGDPSVNAMWTLLGVPVVSVPGLTGVTGLPLGISVIARRYADRSAIRVAELAGAAFTAAGERSSAA